MLFHHLRFGSLPQIRGPGLGGPYSKAYGPRDFGSVEGWANYRIRAQRKRA